MRNTKFLLCGPLSVQLEFRNQRSMAELFSHQRTTWCNTVRYDYKMTIARHSSRYNDQTSACQQMKFYQNYNF